MLLTSGQVSVAISSVVIFMFTSALFLSGYALQQQTVRDLRAAIQPKATPQAARLYLPTQFAVQPTPSPKANAVDGLERAGANIEVIREKPEVVALEGLGHVSEGTPENIKNPIRDDYADIGKSTSQKPIARVEELPRNERESVLDIEAQRKEKPMSRAERRKKIKEEIMAAGEGEGFKGYKRRQY
ncbi:hypothetical protein D0Z07_2984 [Hyphodiscus hymeniophilus]|uniref:Uncharacterized protein n=1 Tax=Hyphodiscus hymeniophilus TaxID=353542 RepID=A0A9P6VMK6_9HELO|nr:hypothetical protein D0Z07_2984 [Hyphodiscus hymeniophilus]